MQCSSVDLPDPDGPMIAVDLPTSKPMSTWSRATTRVFPSPWILVSPSARAAMIPVVAEDCNRVASPAVVSVITEPPRYPLTEVSPD
jgi:hypothetical protein